VGSTDDIISRVSELVSTAEGSGALTGTNYLGSALKKAIATLSTDDGDGEFGAESIDGGEQYAKVFSELSSGFSSLFSEMNNMRSSYLPYGLAKDVPTISGSKTFEELISAESFLESYENTFFRMIGMPSSENLGESERLFSLDVSGVPYSEGERPNKYQYEKEILNTRQLSIESRPIAVGSEIYNFLLSIDPILILKNIGLINTDDLEEALISLGILILNQDNESADSFIGIAEKVAIDEGKVTELVNEQISVKLNIIRSFSKKFKSIGEYVGDLPEISIDDFKASSREVVDAILFIIQPEVYYSIAYEVKTSLINTFVSPIDDETLGSLHVAKNFWRFSRLIFPAVQDGRIGSCINEPRKIVAEPFLPLSMRKVNGNTMRSTLLEAIIRIRIDSVTGTQKIKPQNFSQASITIGSSAQEFDYSDIAENYGTLESLLIVRLFSALVGLALDVNVKIKEMQKSQHSIGIIPDSKGDVEQSALGAGDLIEVEPTPAEAKLNNIREIDDAMLLLLGDNSTNKSLDLQVGMARNSGVIDAHLMSSLVSVITVPSEWAKKNLSKIKEDKVNSARGSGEKDRSEVDTKLGVAKGVGIIDVMAFIIALFSVPESTLLGLLTPTQKNYMIAEFPDGFFDKFFETPDGSKKMYIAIDEVSQAAFDAYELFRSFVKDDVSSGLFVYND